MSRTASCAGSGCVAVDMTAICVCREDGKSAAEAALQRSMEFKIEGGGITHLSRISNEIDKRASKL